MSEPAYRWVADRRCQRGLRFNVALAPALAEVDRLHAALAATFPDAVQGSERWGSRLVRRMILQFRVELRVGERDGQLAVLFRTCCPPAERERIVGAVNASLDRLSRDASTATSRAART